MILLCIGIFIGLIFGSNCNQCKYSAKSISVSSAEDPKPSPPSKQPSR